MLLRLPRRENITSFKSLLGNHHELNRVSSYLLQSVSPLHPRRPARGTVWPVGCASTRPLAGLFLRRTRIFNPSARVGCPRVFAKTDRNPGIRTRNNFCNNYRSDSTSDRGLCPATIMASLLTGCFGQSAGPGHRTARWTSYTKSRPGVLPVGKLQVWTWIWIWFSPDWPHYHPLGGGY